MTNWQYDSIKDTRRESPPLNKTQALTESINIDILVIGTLNQLLIRGSYNKITFGKKSS